MQRNNVEHIDDYKSAQQHQHHHHQYSCLMADDEVR